MLADDPDEAEEQAERYLAEKPLLSYYDEVVLKGLQLAADDIARGTLTPAQVERLKSLDDAADRRSCPPQRHPGPESGSRGGSRLRQADRAGMANPGRGIVRCRARTCWTRRRRRCWPNCCIYAGSGHGPSPMLPCRAPSLGPWTCARPRWSAFPISTQRQSGASAIPDPPLARAARRGADPGRVMAGGRRDIAGSRAASVGRGRLLCQHAARSG